MNTPFAPSVSVTYARSGATTRPKSRWAKNANHDALTNHKEHRHASAALH